MVMSSQHSPGLAILSGLALLGLRNDNSPEYMEKQANIAKDRLLPGWEKLMKVGYD